MLARLASNQPKAGTQTFMAGDQMVECVGQSAAMKLAGQAQRHRDMVSQTGRRVELAEEP
ncbi:hypothetical protein Xkoz_03644 [Xenorhabdus kozodoii]|uniref:Uncharacterized protein n=1 Tax=Xenorhabdus kozodoii TaxID=351676 RepID=A0A2D0KYZ9_9GAMM|nr:hypothetical protein Xkoz_03644 [Xenorhabdus kozodoii]